MSHPPRLRDLEARAQIPRQRRRRMMYILALVALLPIIIVLGYGLLRQSVLHPSVDATIERSDMVVRQGEQIQVEVVNACGVDGVAKRFTEFLRARRFDVAETSTAAERERDSRVLDRVGDTVSARKVAYALGIPYERVETAIDSSLFLRATVIIGADYTELRPSK